MKNYWLTVREIFRSIRIRLVKLRLRSGNRIFQNLAFDDIERLYAGRAANFQLEAWRTIHVEQGDLYQYSDTINDQQITRLTMELSRRLFLACNGHVFSAKGIVYNPYYNCTVLETVEEWGNDVNNSTEYTRITKQPLYSLSGVTISLLSIGAVYNYAHFLFDSIARLVLLDKVPVVADRILISGPKTAWKEKIISHLRLSEKVVWVEAEDELQCEQLVFTNRINYSRHISPFAISAIRKLFLLGTDSGVLPRPHRILFASRTNAKDRQHKFENLIQELLPSIVEIVDFEQLSMEETIKRCSECKCFIGVHGAAFSNLVFCNPHTKVAEFQIESVLPEWHRNYYQTLRGPLNFSYEVHLLNDTQQSTDIKIIIDTIIAQAMDAPSS